MKKLTRTAMVMAALLLVTASSQALANCTHFGTGIPIFQCGFKGFFAPKPLGAGTISATWWQLGYGNKGISNGFGTGNGAPPEGTGIGPQSPLTFSGNDSGQFSMVLTDARTALPAFAASIPAGSLCSNFQNSWGAGGVDGCPDNPRAATAYDNDDVVNRYFDYNGAGSYSTNYQIDYPMAVLLTESTNQFVAIAFLANTPRGSDAASRSNDTSEGFFSLADISNGTANPIDAGKNSVIPWQAIPKQRVDNVTFTNPGDKQNSPRQLALSWLGLTPTSDGSTRPSGRPLNNPGNGVGVADQGPVIRYVVEGAPVTTANPDPSLLTFAPLATTSGNTATVTVGPDTAIRLRTIFGKAPATSAVSLTNAREGKLGDMGYEATSGLTIIAGPLVSERAINLVASKNKNVVEVQWETTSELTATGFEIVGRSSKGDFTIKNVSCKKCSTGEGAVYNEIITAGDLKGAKEIKVRMLGPNTETPYTSLK